MNKSIHSSIIQARFLKVWHHYRTGHPEGLQALQLDKKNECNEKELVII